MHTNYINSSPLRLIVLSLCVILSLISISYGQQKQIDLMRSEVQKNFKQVDKLEWNPNTNVPDLVRGKLAEGINLQNQGQIKQLLKKTTKMFRMSEIDGDFAVKKVMVDNLKMTHARTQQTHKGVPVWGSELLVHSDASGTVTAINGRVTPDLGLDVAPSISAEAALQIAQKDLGLTTYRWLNTKEEQMIKEVFKDQSRSWKPRPELCVAPHQGDFEKGEYMLAWKMMIPIDGEKMGNYEYFVDAKSGEIILKFNSLMHDVGIGMSNYYGTVSFNTKFVSPIYQLYDESQSIKTYTANGFAFIPGNLLTDADNYWNSNNDGVDVHWSVSQSYKFYKDVFGWMGLDNNGAEIRSTVQYPLGNNAQWDGVQMEFGEGDDINYTSWTSLDICGHEYTHGVIQNTANLIYWGESGALNESIADIFGTAIEFYTPGSSPNWQIAEKIYTAANPKKALRYMDNPNSSLAETPQPDTYLGTYWYYGTGDNGGVHINSGPLNYVFYLMSEGGSGADDNGTPFSVTKIGIVKARQITYNALSFYLIGSSSYVTCRNAFLASAEDIYGTGSTELATVAEAFKAIGVYSQTVPVSILAAKYFENGNGDSYKVNGTNVGTSWSGSLPSDEPMTIEAVVPSGYFLYEWSDGSEMNPLRSIPTSPIKAVYKMPLGSSNEIPTRDNGQQRFVSNTDGSKYHLVYESGEEIWYTSYDVNTSNWSPEERISNGYGSNGDPSICNVGDILYVVFRTGTESFEVNLFVRINGVWNSRPAPVDYDNAVNPKPVISHYYNTLYGRNMIIVLYRLNSQNLSIRVLDDYSPYMDWQSAVIPCTSYYYSSFYSISQPTPGADRVTICYTSGSEDKLYSADYSTSLSSPEIVPASNDVALVTGKYGAYHPGTGSVTWPQVLRYNGRTLYSWIEAQTYDAFRAGFVVYQERTPSGTWESAKIFDNYWHYYSLNSLTLSRASDQSVLAWRALGGLDGDSLYQARISASQKQMFFTGLYGHNPQISVCGGVTPPTKINTIYCGGTDDYAPAHMHLGSAIDPSQQTLITLGKRWNLVSVPRIQLNYDASVLFPDKFGALFSYNTSTKQYEAVSILANGPGYWLNYSASASLFINGSATGPLGVIVASAGWVLLGSRTTSVNQSSIILSNGASFKGEFYSYNPERGIYEITSVINPGQGVWANVDRACTITIPAP